MIEPRYSSKLFAEINTVKNYAQFLLNCIRKKNDPELINMINTIRNGQFTDGMSPEIVLLDALLNHPERFIKALDAHGREVIYLVIKPMLDDFLAEKKYSEQPNLSLRV